MRTALNALTDELRRLKTTGIKSVSVSEASLLALRAVIRGRQSSSAVAGKVAAPERPIAVPPMPVAKPKVVEPKLPPPPVVTLPAGDKAGRWAALVAAAQTDPVALAHVPPGKKKSFAGRAILMREFCLSVMPQAWKKSRKVNPLSVRPASYSRR